MISIRTNYRDKSAGRKSGAAFLLTFMLVITMALAGCSSSSTDSGMPDDDNNGNNGSTNPPAAADVTMEGLSFLPGELTVEVGSTVTWRNESSVIHTVTSGTDGTHDGLFDSGNLGPDEEFSYTFTEEGSYPYYCIPHVNQGMTGTITVVAAD